MYRLRPPSAEEMGILSLGSEIFYAIEKSKTIDRFKISIINMVNQLEGSINRRLSMDELCSIFSFQKRRLYDVVNVFDALGYCQKVCSDIILWLGRNGVKENFKKLSQMKGIQSSDEDLESIFPPDGIISMGNLTIAFITCFFALNRTSLDMKEVVSFLSSQKHGGNGKTTVGKLYQISHILVSAGILRKAPGSTRLELAADMCSGIFRIGREALSITSLLSQPIGNEKSVYDIRFLEFKKFSLTDSLSAENSSPLTQEK